MAVKTVAQRKLDELRDLCEGGLMPETEYVYSPANGVVIPKDDKIVSNNRFGADWHLLVIARPDEARVQERYLEEMASEVYEAGQTKAQLSAAIEGLTAETKKVCYKRAFQYVLELNTQAAKHSAGAAGKIHVAGSLAQDMRNAFSKPADMRAQA